jgi:hypothetical protein
VKKLKSKTKILREKTRMKKLITICSVVTMILAIATSSANAGLVTINSWQTQQYTDSLCSTVNAGEINITTSGILGITNVTSFNTFCVETREHVGQATYNAQANTAAIQGGTNGGTDPLNAETAWLFNQYLTGAVVLNTTADMADFQVAIWMWEGEVQDPLSGNALTYYQSAIGKSLGGPDGIGPIRVLNLGTVADNFMYQDILVPEPATICLLGFGALSLIRRKRT